MTDKIWFGSKYEPDLYEGGNAGYRVYIYEYGFIGLIMITSFYLLCMKGYPLKSSLPLFIIVVCVVWGISLSLIYPFVITFDATDFWWWVSVFLIYVLSIGLPILIYPRTMSKIHLDETGISKIVFRKSKERF